MDKSWQPWLHYIPSKIQLPKIYLGTKPWQYTTLSYSIRFLHNITRQLNENQQQLIVTPNDWQELLLYSLLHKVFQSHWMSILTTDRIPLNSEIHHSRLSNSIPSQKDKVPPVLYHCSHGFPPQRFLFFGFTCHPRSCQSINCPLLKAMAIPSSTKLSIVWLNLYRIGSTNP